MAAQMMADSRITMMGDAAGCSSKAFEVAGDVGDVEGPQGWKTYSLKWTRGVGECSVTGLRN
jgi:hypothetical protein